MGKELCPVPFHVSFGMVYSGNIGIGDRELLFIFIFYMYFSTNLYYLSLDLRDLRAIKAKVIHQSFFAEHERNDRFVGNSTADLGAGPERYNGYGCVTTYLPALTISKIFQSLIGHERNYNTLLLPAKLKPYRSGGSTVIIDRFAVVAGGGQRKSGNV